MAHGQQYFGRHVAKRQARQHRDLQLAAQVLDHLDQGIAAVVPMELVVGELPQQQRLLPRRLPLFRF